MKIILVGLVLICYCTPISGKDIFTGNTITLEKGWVSVSGFGSYTKDVVSTDLAVSVAYPFENWISFGLEYCYSQNSLRRYAGGLVELQIFSNSIVHPVVLFSIGGCKEPMQSIHPYLNAEVALEFNIWKKLRLDVGADLLSVGLFTRRYTPRIFFSVKIGEF